MSLFLRPKAPTPEHVVDRSDAGTVAIPQPETIEQRRARLRAEGFLAVRVFAVLLMIIFFVGLAGSGLLLLAERRTP